MSEQKENLNLSPEQSEALRQYLTDVGARCNRTYNGAMHVLRLLGLDHLKATEPLSQTYTYVVTVTNNEGYEWVEPYEIYTHVAETLEEVMEPNIVYQIESIFEDMWQDSPHNYTIDTLPVSFQVHRYCGTAEQVPDTEVRRVLIDKLEGHRKFVRETLAQEAKEKAEKQKDVDALKKEMERLGLTAEDLGL